MKLFIALVLLISFQSTIKCANSTVVSSAPTDIVMQTIYLESTNSMFYYLLGTYQGLFTYYMQIYNIQTGIYQTLQNLPNQIFIWSFKIMAGNNLICGLVVVNDNGNRDAVVACWNYTTGSLYNNFTVGTNFTGRLEFTNLYQSSDQVLVAVGSVTGQSTTSMMLSVWNITSSVKIWQSREKVIGSVHSICFNQDMLTMIGDSNVFNGTTYLYAINQCQIRNILSSTIFPLKFSLPNIVVDGTETYEYAFAIPFLHPTLANYVAVTQFKDNQPAAPLPVLIVNTQLGQIINTANIDFGQNELLVYCKTLYNTAMLLVCTDNYNFKIFNLNSTASPVEPTYTLQIPTAPLQQQEAWDVNIEGTTIYFTTSNSTYSWIYASNDEFQ